MITTLELLDPIVVKQKVAEQYLAHDYSRKNRDGDFVPDDNKLKARVHELVTSKVVTTKEDVAKNSWSPGEIYAAAFANAPGTDKKTIHLLDDLDAAIRHALIRKVWGLTQPRRTGYIQKKLGIEGKDLVLCRSTTTRGLDDVEVCFVTGNPDLIMSESVMPQIESLVKKADDLRLHAEMVRTRKPELEGRLLKELGLGVGRVSAALPQGSAPAGSDGHPGDRESK
jgi:hypothetical protein